MTGICKQGPVGTRFRPVIVEPDSTPQYCRNCDARAASVCSSIDDQDLHHLASIATVMEMEGGRTFINEGDPADHFYNLTRGTVRLFKLLPDGRRQITGFGHRGDFLGLAVSSTYAFSAEAIDQVRFCRFSRRALRRVLDDFPALEKRLLEVASNELVAAQEQMLLLGRKTARERLASFLLLLESRLACPHEGKALVLPMTRSDVADYLGLTLETVSRTFARLKKERLVETPRSDTVELVDRDALAELAAGNGTSS